MLQKHITCKCDLKTSYRYQFFVDKIGVSNSYQFLVTIQYVFETTAIREINMMLSIYYYYCY